MSITSLQSAASGLSALNTAMDVISNNLANVNTAGFKSSRANFQDLLYTEKAQPGVENANGDQRPTGLYVGLGTKVSGTQLDFTQGSAVTTGRELDLSIEGLGFFQIKVPESVSSTGFAYTRSGQFTRNKDGQIVMATDQGRRLLPDVTIPQDATAVEIASDGRILVKQPGDVSSTEIGHVETAVFVNPAGLKQIGENLYIESPASGPPIVGAPEQDNRGKIHQGQYEASNVDPTRELIELIRVQRAFEMNSNTIRAADDSLRTIAQLRR